MCMITKAKSPCEADRREPGGSTCIGGAAVMCKAFHALKVRGEHHTFLVTLRQSMDKHPEHILTHTHLVCLTAKLCSACNAMLM